MTNPPRRDGWDQEHPGTYSYPADPDEAPRYSGGYQQPYQPAPGPNPTQQLPPYPQYGYDAYGTTQFGGPPDPTDPPEPRGSGPRWWLWVLASAALLLVVGLVIGLVIVNSSQQETLVAPGSPVEPTMTKPTTTARTPSTSTRTRTSTSAPTPSPAPPEETSPGGMETVVYDVAGNGRALSVIYLDTGGVLQTEFNVTLPWSKEVLLSGQVENTATVSVVNVSNQVTCSITVDGQQRDQKTGTGLTLCTALGSR